MYPPDYEVDGQMSLFDDDAKARVKPGRRFVVRRLEFEVVTVEKGTVFIRELKTKKTFTYGLDALIRIDGLSWR